jgi:cytochrome c oxidase subunit 2
MPPSASTVAPDVDGLFSFIFWITVFFFVLVTVLTVVFVWKYRLREGQPPPPKAAAHNTALELTWTIIPTIIVLIIFYFGFRGFLHMSVIPPNAYEINVTAQMWNWQFVYPNGHVDTELHIPVDVPVRLVLNSTDVIHSLYVPQFRVKKDVVPGRFNRFWVQATELSPPEGFDIYCAEYCGNGHSRMLSKVHVHDLQGYKKWLEDASNWETHMTPVQAGEQFFKTRGCTQCHTVTGEVLKAPTLKNVFGEPQKLTNGATVVADENYIRESIYEPAAKVVAGFEPQMPSYKGLLKDNDVMAIIEYLKSISDKQKNETINLTAPTTQAK